MEGRMRSLKLFILSAVTATLFAACGEAPANKPANNAANTNTPKPAAAAPTKEALLELEKKAFEAWSKKDGKHFEVFLADQFVSFTDGKRTGKADEVKMINESKCEVKSHSLSEENMVPVGADAAVLVSKATIDGSCDGKAIPSPLRAVTLFVRSGEAWKAAYHSDTPIVDPTAAPPAAPAKKAEPKKEADAGKKPEGGDSAENLKPADLVVDDLTKALMALETSGWEAWKAKDAAKLGSGLTNDAAFVDPMGTAHFGKAANLKIWAEEQCEVNSVKLSDGMASTPMPSVGLLTFKGTADGTCGGHKLGTLWGTAIYVKEGDVWKLAFHFETPA